MALSEVKLRNDDRYPAAPDGVDAGAATDGYVWTYDAASGGWLPGAANAHSHEHFGRTNNPHNTTREQVAAAPVYSQVINVMADSGRFAGKVNPQQRNLSDTNNPFTASGLFNPYNSASAPASAGKFIHNNTTNGGTAGELTQDVADLLAAMGRSGSAARYGVEFYVAQTTAGSGTATPHTASDGVTRYLLTTNGSRAIFGFGNYATIAFWVRIKSGGSIAIARQAELRLASAPQSADVILSPAEGWVHIVTQMTSSVGYNTAFPFIYASGSGDVVQIACPALFSGQAYPGVHAAPLPSFNDQVTV